MSKKATKGSSNRAKSAGSVGSFKSSRSSKTRIEDIMLMLPIDSLIIKVLSLRIFEENPPNYAMKILFGENMICSSMVKTLGLGESEAAGEVIAKGTFNYDPSNYEKMCQFANLPLVVYIQPMTNEAECQEFLHTNTPTVTSLSPVSVSTPSKAPTSGKTPTSTGPTTTVPFSVPEKKPAQKNVSRCNIDILPLFLGTEKLCIRKRLEPIVPPRPRLMKSWDNLPLLIMSVIAVRNNENTIHQKVLNDANWLKITTIGLYNLSEPFVDNFSYFAVSKLPVASSAVVQKHELALFSQGSRPPKRFQYNNFYPGWEYLRSSFEYFTKSDDKLTFNVDEIANPDDIELELFLDDPSHSCNVIWGSFHRTLLLGDMSNLFRSHHIRWKWPIEVHIYGDPSGTRSFMGFPDLAPLVHPGVRRLIVAVPLSWYNVVRMQENSNCAPLTQPMVFGSGGGAATPSGKSKQTTMTASTGTSEPENVSTGGHDMPSFLLLEIQLHHALVPEAIPPVISRQEIFKMLTFMEAQVHQEKKVHCSGRGQLIREWKATIRTAARGLQRVPYHGMSDLCNINRQLSETRTRVEILNSLWMEAAIYINNNFVIQEYMSSDKRFEELLMMAHVALMKTTSDTLVGIDDWYSVDPALRAARHARQLHDNAHAMELYLQATVQNQYDHDTWRELSTCLKDVDKEFAKVCLNKSLLLETRHALTLLSKACMVFDEDPEGAEPFFDALLELFPFWPVSNIVGYAYYTSREYFRMAQTIKQTFKFIEKDHYQRELHLPFGWGNELGDFWESSILLPGMSRFYTAADLLLRIRAIRMAEICLALALSEAGETAVYCHLVALCYRLRGDYENALCIIRKAIKDFGENPVLLCMEGECLHQVDDQAGAIAAFTKAGGGTCAYSILLSLPCWEPNRVRPILVDLLRRQPSAYGWMALANDWLIRLESLMNQEETMMSQEQKNALECAEACAVQALKWDRRAGRAWALLAKIVHPDKRRSFYSHMAYECGYLDLEDTDLFQLIRHSQESICHRLGVALRECRCAMCTLLSF